MRLYHYVDLTLAVLCFSTTAHSRALRDYAFDIGLFGRNIDTHPLAANVPTSQFLRRAYHAFAWSFTPLRCGEIWAA